MGLMDNVVRLGRVGPILGKPDETVIEVLQDALDKAKAGELAGVAITMIYGNADTTCNWSCGTIYWHQLAGAIARLNWLFQKHWDET